MRGVCRSWVLMLGGSRPDQEVEGDGGAAHRVTVGDAPLRVACSGRKQKCYLLELSKEQATVKPASKRKRGDKGELAVEGKGDEELQASGSGEKASGMGEGGAEAPKKKQRVEVVIPR